MQPPEQPPQQSPEGESSQPTAPQETPSQPTAPQETPSQPLLPPSRSAVRSSSTKDPQETPSQPLRPPRPYPQRLRPSQPLPHQEQRDGPTQPLRLPRLTPKKQAQLLWVLGGGIALVLVLCIVGMVVVIVGSKNASSNIASNPAAISTTAPTTTSTQQPIAEHHQVGESITTASWQVTIDSASAYTGNPNQFETPRAGDTFLVVEGTFKNLTNKTQPLSTIQFFTLQDTQGSTYPEALLNTLAPPEGTVLAARGTIGEWGYEVPTSIHAFVLVFSDDVGQTTSLWEISI